MYYGQFEYTVILFELTIPSATFQSCTDAVLGNYIDDFAECYLDNVLIYSNNIK